MIDAGGEDKVLASTSMCTAHESAVWRRMRLVAQMLILPYLFQAMSAAFHTILHIVRLAPHHSRCGSQRSLYLPNNHTQVHCVGVGATEFVRTLPMACDFQKRPD